MSLGRAKDTEKISSGRDSMVRDCMGQIVWDKGAKESRRASTSRTNFTRRDFSRGTQQRARRRFVSVANAKSN